MKGIKTGDLVYYPLHGVGVLLEKATRLYENQEKAYFNFFFEEIKMNIFIPEDTLKEKGIRALASPEMLKHSQNHFFEKFSKLPNLPSKRRKLLLRKLEKGDILNVTEVIRDLVCSYQYNLKLGSKDKMLLAKACSLMKSELIHSLEISEEKASEILRENISQLDYSKRKSSSSR